MITSIDKSDNAFSANRVISLKQRAVTRSNLLISNFSWLFLDKIIRATGGFLVGVWVARYLGVDQYGALSFAIALVTLLTPLHKLGIDSFAIKSLVETPDRVSEIVGSTFVLKLIGSTLLLALATIIALIIRPNDATFLFITAIVASSHLFRCSDAFSIYFKANVDNKLEVISRNLGYLVTIGLRCACVLSGCSIFFFAATSIAETAIALIALLYFYALHKHRPILVFCIKYALNLLRKGWPMMATSIFSLLYLNIDRVMLGSMLNDSSVGQYAAAGMVSNVFFFVALSIGTIALPLLIKAKQISEREFSEKSRGLLVVYTLLSYSFIAVTLLSADDAITLLFGQDYSQSAQILKIHILGSIFLFTGMARNIWITTYEISKVAMYATLLGAVINIVLNYLLIPEHHGVGAAISTVIALSISNCLFNIIHPVTRRFLRLQLRSLLLLDVLYIANIGIFTTRNEKN